MSVSFINFDAGNLNTALTYNYTFNAWIPREKHFRQNKKKKIRKSQTDFLLPVKYEKVKRIYVYIGRKTKVSCSFVCRKIISFCLSIFITFCQKV